MKRFAYIMIPAMALATAPAWAQTSNDMALPPAAESQPATELLSADKVIVQQEEGQTRADAIIGTSVQSGMGEDAEKVGSISDLLLDENNNLVAALVDVGGFLGIGDKTVALSWNALSFDRAENGDVTVTSDVTREQLEQAPPFQTLEDQIAEEKQEMEKQQMEMQPNPGLTEQPAPAQ